MGGDENVLGQDEKVRAVEAPHRIEECVAQVVHALSQGEVKLVRSKV